MSLFEIVIKAPPFLAGISAIALTKKELNPDKND
jgi:hypothetical protein